MNCIEVNYKNICLLSISLLIISCSSTPEPSAEYRRYITGYQKNKISVSAQYNISDSMAHNYIKIWISRQFQDGIREIIIDDMINGIIAGSSKVTSTIFRTEYTEFITYMIFIKDGNATLNIDTINVLGAFFNKNEEAAQEMAYLFFTDFENRIIESFQKIF